MKKNIIKCGMRGVPHATHAAKGGKMKQGSGQVRPTMENSGF